MAGGTLGQHPQSMLVGLLKKSVPSRARTFVHMRHECDEPTRGDL